MAQSPEGMLKTMIANLPAKTGRRVTHRVRVTDVGDVDDELLEWLRTAYGEA